MISESLRPFSVIQQEAGHHLCHPTEWEITESPEN